MLQLSFMPSWVVILAAGAQIALAAATGPVIDVGYAAFLGNSSVPGVHFFGNISYVKPPLGNLRWRKPQALDETPVSGAKTPVNAQWFGSPCLQQPAQVGPWTDDCLTLNIWKPAAAKAGDKLPVALYIHGGGNYGNSAPAFPMSHWVSISNSSIVAVNIQYRLGALGFLASSAVIADGDVNVGLFDQRAAFEWVRRHITQFGGDPNQITIIGESAGAGDVVFHMTAYRGQGDPLFQRAVVQSIGTDPIPNSTVYEFCFANFSATVGCTSSNPMPCLRTAPLSTIVTAINNKPSTCKYLPVIDGDFIQDYPSRLLAQGKFHKVPFIGGHCADDGAGFVGKPSSFVNTTDGFVAAITKRYVNMTESTKQRMIQLYPASSFSSTFERAKTAFGDTIFTCQDYFIAKKLRESGVNYVYNFRWNTPDPVQLAKDPWKGTMHTSDLFFLFNGTNSGTSASSLVFTPFKPAESTLAKEAVGYWTSFVRSSDPSTHSSLSTAPRWTDVSTGRLLIQEGAVEDTASTMQARTADYEARCVFWNEVGAEIGL